MENNTAVLWIRVSSEEQAKGYSINAQERILEDVAKTRNLRIVKKFLVTESAKTSDNRKHFKSLIEFIKQNDVGNLVVLVVDRLGRNYEDLTAIQSLIDRNDLTVILAESNRSIHRGSPVEDRFLFQMMGSLSEMENRLRGKKTLHGMTQKALQGWRPGMAPLGYLNAADPADPSGRKRTIILDPVRAPLVKQMFELYAKGGWAFSTILKEMIRRGLTTKKGTPITDKLIEIILRNPFYYGRLEWNGEIHDGAHPPLITRKVFDRVQEQKRLNQTYSRPGSKKYFAFKPFLKCGYCGCQITAESQSGRRDKRTFNYYHCSFSKDTDKKCPQGYHREEKIDALITEALGNLQVPAWMCGEITTRLKETHTRETAFEKNELARLRSEETRKKSHLDIIYSDRLNGILTPEEYKERAEAVRKELALIAADIAALSKHNFKYKEDGSFILELLSGLKDIYMKADLPGKAKILSVVLNRVILKGEDTQFVWKEPFGFLFDINRILSEKKGKDVVLRKEGWGG